MIRLLLGAAIVIPLGLDLYLPVPEDNPLTPARVALGRRLFRERALSRDRLTACITCHDPSRAFTDGRPVAIGGLGVTGTRSAPTLVNRGYGRSQFWDGRARTLEEQVLEPVTNPRELDLTIDEAITRIAASREYRREFHSAFGNQVNARDLARALASYVRTILSGDSAYDRYVNGDRDALSDVERRGLEVFRGKGNCTACHGGPMLSDERFHNTGIAWQDGAWKDMGRFEVTGREADRGAFKTPTLRDIARTTPYMHDGSVTTLEAVVEHYDRGGIRTAYLDPEIQPLHLTSDEKRALVAFLQTLAGRIHEGMD